MTAVLISGASIAGPALAYWLDRYGFTVTVVERAPSLRPGGQAVDFKGVTHRRVLAEMGILDEVHRRQTGRTDLVIVDQAGRRQATLPGEFTGGDVEILRGDLAELLYEHTADRCEYVFGDSITGLTDTGDEVEVTFAHGAPRSFDLVIGADGIHSAVRRLAFGPEQDYVEHLGYYYAVAGGSPDGAGERRTGLMYNEPGRMATEGGPKAPRMFVFASDPISYDRTDVEQQRRVLTDAFAGAGWEVPRLLAGLTDDLYLDAIARVRMDSYVAGRVALLGDAAYGNTLGGFGTGLAVVGAYVLAGELAAADHRTAFRRYDELMHGYAKIARTGSAGSFLAPRTATRIRLRNWMLRFSLPMRLMMKLTDRFATDIRLADYPGATRACG
jgi:2-polyprenyl-6-methoxyphenol hydroxylase-like FAD-dependent oxidoreductase